MWDTMWDTETWSKNNSDKKIMSTRGLKCCTIIARVSCVWGKAPFLQPLFPSFAAGASAKNGRVTAAKWGERAANKKGTRTKRHRHKRKAPLS